MQPHIPEQTPEPLHDDPEIPGAFTASIEDFAFPEFANSSTEESLPRTLREAYSGPDKELWKSAVEEELQSLNSNHVYETVLIPEGITPITSKPVFHIKWNQAGNIE